MKGTVKRIRRQTTDWEKIHANDISDKGQLSKIYKALFSFCTVSVPFNPSWYNHFKNYVDQETEKTSHRPGKIFVKNISDKRLLPKIYSFFLFKMLLEKLSFWKGLFENNSIIFLLNGIVTKLFTLPFPHLWKETTEQSLWEESNRWAAHHVGRGSIKIYKKFWKLNSKKMNNPI